jgi:hypothetical protein
MFLFLNRSLARVKLIITLSFCVNPSYFLIDTIPGIAHKVVKRHFIQLLKFHQQKTEYIQFGIKFCYDKYTARCFFYFVGHC